MDLKCSLEECAMALNLFLNNKFSEALELLRPWSKDSMYHALGYGTILVMQAAMTFEQQDIQLGISTMKEALQTCQRFRKRSTVVESLSNLVSKQSVDQLSEEEMHAEICYAECLLQKAALTFVQDENMINFIKGGLKIRTSYQIYKECLQVLQMTQGIKSKNETYHQFEGGVKLGIGAFNLLLSLLPGRILRLLEFIGFSGNRDIGLLQLREGASGTSLRAILCTFTLLVYHTFVCFILGTGEANLEEAETLLEPYLQKFPNGSIILFYAARISILQGNFEKAIYVFQKAAILCMLPDDDVKKTGEDIVSLFRQIEGLRQRIAGKSIPTEKFAVRKSRRYASSRPVKLILPALEMMYVWNGFAVVGKRTDLTESLLITIEKEETALQNEARKNQGKVSVQTESRKWKQWNILDSKENQRDHSEYYMDDVCLLQLLKGLCLKYLGRLLQAELCFNQVIQSEKQIKYDNYLVPFTLYELGLLYKQRDEREKAIRYIETAKNNYKDYSMESRLHFRIHAALDSLKVTPASTP
ncbi:PREDICTED: tetratricopeptide repeat protein 39B [Crocodylus porosus]|uniref:tetratricopeptide repeat protein 39B n=1 Tax=Crocodylus porosus TaxID=8502 RepID=UPI00093D5C61|nr:PREDICTED: tetratricopeptide repeat protein 39B [Crocodylus porosus]